MFELEHSMSIFESCFWKRHIFAFLFLGVFFFFLDGPLCQPHLWNAINPVCSCPVLQYDSPLD